MNGIEYDTIRHFADSWGLVFLLAAFAGGVLWALRPGSSYRAHADIPFKHDDDEHGGRQ